MGSVDKDEERSDPTRDRLEALCRAPLTEEILHQLSDEDALELAYWRALELVDDEATGWKRRVRQLSHGQRVLILAMGLRGIVDNGGFDAVFENPGFFPWRIGGTLRVLGAVRNADLLQRAIDVMDRELRPRGRRLNAYASTELSDVEDFDLGELDECNEEFFQLQESEDIYRLSQRYVREHTDEFIR
jgi:hypothetical protein